jgi:3'(2'), 5'-bisphosphate nucleotidase
MTDTELKKLTLIAVNASIAAGAVVLKHYNSSYSIEYKSDLSPLTSADKEAHEVITASLAQTNLPILSEEGKDIAYEQRKQWELFWLVDPLDGTKEFINGNGEFTVNIALIKDGIPILGVVYVPIGELLYFSNYTSGSHRSLDSSVGSVFNDYSELINNSVKLPLSTTSTVTIMGSRSHLTIETSQIIQALVNKFGDVTTITAGSSLKFCKLAEGTADIYPRLGPTMEWDTAAGHAVCMYASISVIDYNTKEELVYNKSNLLNPWFIAFKPKRLNIREILDGLNFSI